LAIRAAVLAGRNLCGKGKTVTEQALFSTWRLFKLYGASRQRIAAARKGKAMIHIGQ
jgi:hypothetical protein